jgi:predicted amino acid-binding ACT domain protein
MCKKLSQDFLKQVFTLMAFLNTTKKIMSNNEIKVDAKHVAYKCQYNVTMILYDANKSAVKFILPYGPPGE